MKVNKEITQLSLDTALLVVMGSHYGIIYKLENDELTQVDDHRVDTPIYSDNEGMFKGGGSDNPKYGSVLELKKQKAQEDFSKEFTQKIQEICALDSIKSIYLFAPLESKSLIDSDWSNVLKEFIVERFDGNYTQKHPTEILDMLYKKISSKNTKI